MQNGYLGYKRMNILNHSSGEQRYAPSGPQETLIARYNVVIAGLTNVSRSPRPTEPASAYQSSYEAEPSVQAPVSDVSRHASTAGTVLVDASVAPDYEIDPNQTFLQAPDDFEEAQRQQFIEKVRTDVAQERQNGKFADAA